MVGTHPCRDRTVRAWGQGAVGPSKMVTHLENEAELVAAARGGDGGAFSRLANHYADRIYRLALRITERPQDAEDVLQEAMLKAFAKLAEFRGEARFYTWLVRIAVNEALGLVRRRGEHKMIFLDEPIGGEEKGWMPRDIEAWDENPEQRFAREELQALVSETIAALPAGLRAVFLLRDVEQLSTEQTAEMLGLSLAASKTRLHRARLQVRERLSPHFAKGYAVGLQGSHPQAL